MVAALECGVCRLSIDPTKEVVGEVDDVKLHSDCFKCTVCLEPFANGSYYPVNGQPYCEECHTTLYSTRCAECMEIITGKSITAAGKKYHLNCFTCPSCSTSLVGERFLSFKGVPMCKPCHGKKLTRGVGAKAKDLCFKCKKPIQGSDFVMWRGKRHCSHHFNCKSCRIVLTKNAREHNDDLYCGLCYEKVKVKYCFACKLPIEGRVITALSKSWCPNHFVCCICEMSFSHDPFFEHKGQAYCETHYHRMFGKVCFKTNQPMKHGEIEALNKVWGTESFDCFGCGCNLSQKMKFVACEGRPFCKRCRDGFDKNARVSLRRCQDARDKAAKEATKLEKS